MLKPLTMWITVNWKILKEIGIPDRLICLLRNLYAGQEATVRTRHGTTDGSKLGKEYVKAIYCHTAYLIYTQSTSCEMPDHFTCLLWNLYAGQEATVRTGHGMTDWFQIGKGVRQGYILSPCLFNFCVEYIMRNTGLDEAQAWIKVTSDMQMTPPLGQKAKKN